MQCSVGKHEKGPFRYENVTIPKLVDWRQRDIVGPIKDQVCIDLRSSDITPALYKCLPPRNSVRPSQMLHIPDLLMAFSWST